MRVLGPWMLWGAAYPMVVMKLEVKESSEKRSSRQLLPTPARATG